MLHRGASPWPPCSAPADVGQGRPATTICLGLWPRRLWFESPRTHQGRCYPGRPHAPLAQLAEQRTLNPQVLGSSPRGGTHEGPGQSICPGPLSISAGTRTHVSREQTPAQVEQLCLLPSRGTRHVRRSRLHPDDNQLTIDAASDGKRVKPTKTRKERKVAVDPETMEMLLRHCVRMDERAEQCGLEIGPSRLRAEHLVGCRRESGPAVAHGAHQTAFTASSCPGCAPALVLLPSLRAVVAPASPAWPASLRVPSRPHAPRAHLRARPWAVLLLAAR